VAPSEHNEADVHARRFLLQRAVVYAVAVVALVVVLWALIEGGERDPLTQTASSLSAAIAFLAP